MGIEEDALRAYDEKMAPQRVREAKEAEALQARLCTEKHAEDAKVLPLLKRWAANIGFQSPIEHCSWTTYWSEKRYCDFQVDNIMFAADYADVPEGVDVRLYLLECRLTGVSKLDRRRFLTKGPRIVDLASLGEALALLNATERAEERRRSISNPLGYN